MEFLLNWITGFVLSACCEHFGATSLAVFPLTCFHLKLWTKKWVTDTHEFWKKKNSQISQKIKYVNISWVFRWFYKTIFCKIEIWIRLTWHEEVADATHCEITMPTFLRSWRSITLFNWNDYCERRKPSYNHIKSLSGNTVHLQLSFVILCKTAMEACLLGHTKDFLICKEMWWELVEHQTVKQCRSRPNILETS